MFQILVLDDFRGFCLAVFVRPGPSPVCPPSVLFCLVVMGTDNFTFSIRLDNFILSQFILLIIVSCCFQMHPS